MSHPPAKVYNVLFVCTHNSARSVLAEGLMNSLGHGRFVGYSAGSTPSGRINPYALSTLERMGIPSAGYRSKDWAEFDRPGAPLLDFIITVCDNAAGEACPFWPGHPAAAHWGVEDPAAVAGSDDDKRAAFLKAYSILRRRIDLLLALPLDKLDALAKTARLKEIGKAP